MSASQNLIRLPQDFYKRYDTAMLARQLLGCEIVHYSPEGQTAGIIVETEAYFEHDPASHSFGGRRTQRNEAMFGTPGSLYVYLIYGMYDCINVVSGPQDKGEAVLIRALEPTQGIALMTERRRLHPRTQAVMEGSREPDLRNLCNGPGKLAQAMGFNKIQHNSLSLTGNSLFIKPAQATGFEIVTTARIGITKGADLPYRFYIKGNRFVSRY